MFQEITQHLASFTPTRVPFLLPKLLSGLISITSGCLSNTVSGFIFFSSNRKSNASEQTVFEEAHDASRKSSSSSNSSLISKVCGPSMEVKAKYFLV